jgi:hypothetical protein
MSSAVLSEIATPTNIPISVFALDFNFLGNVHLLQSYLSSDIAPVVAPSIAFTLADLHLFALWPILPQFLHVPLNFL